MRKFMGGLILGILIGGAAVWFYRDTIEKQIDVSKAEVGKTLKDVGTELREKGNVLRKKDGR